MGIGVRPISPHIVYLNNTEQECAGSNGRWESRERDSGYFGRAFFHFFDLAVSPSGSFFDFAVNVP
jgi:hypothetical protein